MKYLIILAIGLMLGYFIFSRKNKENFISEQTEQKAENKRKILDLLNTKRQINNTDIENHLGVSDATATRYLDELEKEREVKQVVATGKHVYYEKT